MGSSSKKYVRLKKCDQMSKERSNLTIILKLDVYARSFITVHSLNNAGKNIFTKTFNILDSDHLSSPGGRVTRLLKIPWASQLSLSIFGKLVELFLCEKQTWLC